MIWGLCLGTLLILLGLSHITKSVIGIRIPVFSVIFGLFLLYIGIELITGTSRTTEKYKGNDKQSGKNCSSYMGTFNIAIDPTSLKTHANNLDYSIFLGKIFVTLKMLNSDAIRITGAPLIIHVNTVMAKTHIDLHKEIPTRIIARSSCAKVSTPDNCSIVLGTHTYDTHVHEEPLVIIYVSTVLGKTKISFAQ